MKHLPLPDVNVSFENKSLLARGHRLSLCAQRHNKRFLGDEYAMHEIFATLGFKFSSFLEMHLLAEEVGIHATLIQKQNFCRASYELGQGFVLDGILGQRWWSAACRRAPRSLGLCLQQRNVENKSVFVFCFVVIKSKTTIANLFNDLLRCPPHNRPAAGRLPVLGARCRPPITIE